MFNYRLLLEEISLIGEMSQSDKGVAVSSEEIPLIGEMSQSDKGVAVSGEEKLSSKARLMRCLP